MQWQLIESDDTLAQLLDREGDADVVVVDTEFMRRNTYYPEVALVQLCFESARDTAWLIDPLKIADPTPLVELLTDASVLKVLHSASEDLEVFQRWLGVLPQPLFDTQRAAALLNLGFGLGYRALVQAICSVDLPKGETRSNWLQRPLTGAQCDYAAQDVTWLMRVWEDLHSQCERDDRLDWVLADGRDALAALVTGDGASHRRIKSAWKLSPRQLGTLAAVCRWREETARDRNRPRAWIIDDKTCLDLATRDPKTSAELRDGLGLPAPVLRRYSDTLLDLLAWQRSLPAAELPQRLPTPLNASQRELVKRLKAQVRDMAESLAVAPEILMVGKDYELLLREAAGETISCPGHWDGWRRDKVLVPLREYLAGFGS
jgi:ribonuclease D